MSSEQARAASHFNGWKRNRQRIACRRYAIGGRCRVPKGTHFHCHLVPAIKMAGRSALATLDTSSARPLVASILRRTIIWCLRHRLNGACESRKNVCCKICHHPSPFQLNQMIFSGLSGDGKVTANLFSGKRKSDVADNEDKRFYLPSPFGAEGGNACRNGKKWYGTGKEKKQIGTNKHKFGPQIGTNKEKNTQEYARI